MPSTNIPVPASVLTAAHGRRVRPVWENELGGITFEVGADPERCFVKWTPLTSGIDLSDEVARLSWAVAFTPVPRVLAQGADDAGSWIVTAALPGDSLVSHRWKAQPARAVRALGAGLRALHEALPVRSCPFSWSVGDRLADVRRRAAAGRLDPTHWHETYQPLGVKRALDVLAEAPPVDQLVVCAVLTESLSIPHPIVLAPMGGCAGGALAAAVSNGGGLGLVGGARGNRDWLERELALVADHTTKPWGVGFPSWAVAQPAP